MKDKERTLAEKMFGFDENLEEVLEKKRKLDETRLVKKPVDLPYYLKTQEDTLNYIK